MLDDEAIRAESLEKTYRSGGGEVLVFDNLSLRVPRGERLAIIGESGAGKSTLLHLLGGLDKPTRGEIHFGRRRVDNLSDSEVAEFRNRTLGFVWQKPFLLPEFTALENVAMPLIIRGIRPTDALRTARERLAEVGLSARESHLAGELSGGEQQRVSLARALVAGPSVLLADEPTGSLDFRTGEAIINLLTDVHSAHGLTSVFVTHNLSFASRCDRVLELRNGRLQLAPARQLQEAEIVQDATRLDGGTYV